jgi:hypothetical protein
MTTAFDLGGSPDAVASKNDPSTYVGDVLCVS